MERTKSINETLQLVKAHLPAPGAELGVYTFLAPEDLWTGTVDTQRQFVVVAEEDNAGGNAAFLMIVLSDGPVYIAELCDSQTEQAAARDTLDLREENLICYCAADFPKFMEIMKLYLAVYQTVAEAVPEGEDSELYSEAEQELRQQIEAIDPTAIADENGLWSTMLEEFGSGMTHTSHTKNRHIIGSYATLGI